MTRDEALRTLADHGIVGHDAETALDAALARGHTQDVSTLIRRVYGRSEGALMEFYGSDAGRVAVVFSNLDLDIAQP